MRNNQRNRFHGSFLEGSVATMNLCSKHHNVAVDRHSKKLGVCASQHRVLKLLTNFKDGILLIKILHHGF
jgi:hypothetical protein